MDYHVKVCECQFRFDYHVLRFLQFIFMQSNLCYSTKYTMQYQQKLDLPWFTDDYEKKCMCVLIHLIVYPGPSQLTKIGAQNPLYLTYMPCWVLFLDLT